MNARIQKLCALAGPAFIVILLPAWFFMGFLPPLEPTLSPELVQKIYDDNRNGIRLGATLTMQFTMFGVLWTCAIAAQMRRIEAGSTPILTYVQLVTGAIGFTLFVFPAVLWTVAAFRPERDIELLYLINDYAWLALVMPIMAVTLQAFAIGLVVLSDEHENPIFPRWSGYFNFWCGIVFLPGAVAGFFKTGPFAWNGLFDFSLPLAVFALWIIVMAFLVVNAADRQAIEDSQGN